MSQVPHTVTAERKNTGIEHGVELSGIHTKSVKSGSSVCNVDSIMLIAWSAIIMAAIAYTLLDIII